MADCKQCGKCLTGDEIGLTKKLMGKAVSEFLCLDCLAVHFGCGTALLQSKIAQYKKMGCALFAGEDNF
ncbi:MAG: hypothetical protein IJ766_09055 [Clostridia bacterium]|nr:hypothetical protein [Clostridia bacterium]